jgi:hypothetical protein
LFIVYTAFLYIKAVKRKSKSYPVEREEMSPAESISKHGGLKTTFELYAELE